MRTKYGKMLTISESCEGTWCSLYGSCNLFEELEFSRRNIDAISCMSAFSQVPL